MCNNHELSQDQSEVSEHRDETDAANVLVGSFCLDTSNSVFSKSWNSGDFLSEIPKIGTSIVWINCFKLLLSSNGFCLDKSKKLLAKRKLMSILK